MPAPTVTAQEVDLTPHQGTEASDFFQTNESLQRQQAQQAKLELYRDAGKPVKTPSKVLQLLPVPAQVARFFLDDSSDDGIFLTAESGFICRVLRLETGKTMRTLRGHKGPVTCVQLLPVMMPSQSASRPNVFAVSGSWDKTIRKWNLNTGECVLVMEGHADFVKCLAVHHYPQGNPFNNDQNQTLIFSGSSDASIRVWNAETGAQLAKLDGHRRAVEAIVIDYAGETLYSASSDTTIRQYNLRTQECVAVLEGHQTSVVDLHLLEDDEALWSASADCTVRRWDLKTRQSDTTLKHKDWVGTITMLGGAHLVSGGREEKVRVWDLQTEKVKHVFEGHCDEVSSLAVINNGATIVSASYDCTIRQWDLADADKKKKSNSKEEAEDQKEDAKEPAIGAAAEGVQLTAEEEAELAELMD